MLRDHSGNLSVAQTYATVGDPPPPPAAVAAGAARSSQPDAVSVPGDANSEMGCPGDWQPDCDQAQLTLDPRRPDLEGHVRPPGRRLRVQGRDQPQRGTRTTAPAGCPNGANIPFTPPRRTGDLLLRPRHALGHERRAERPIITAPGQRPVRAGLPGRLGPDCMRPWLQDPDGDGTWTWSTTRDPGRLLRGRRSPTACLGRELRRRRRARRRQHRATPSRRRRSRDVQLRAGDARADRHDSRAGPVPDLDQPRAHWLERGLLAWDLPADGERLDASGCTPRPTGGLAVDEEAILGGVSFPLTLDPAGLPDDVREQWPHLAGYDALRLSTQRRARRRAICSPVSSRSPRTTTSDGSSTPPACRSPASSTTSTATPYDRDLGVTWHGGTPKLAVWAPTAKDVDLLVRAAGATTDTRGPDAPRRRRRLVGDAAPRLERSAATCSRSTSTCPPRARSRPTSSPTRTRWR